MQQLKLNFKTISVTVRSRRNSNYRENYITKWSNFYCNVRHPFYIGVMKILSWEKLWQRDADITKRDNYTKRHEPFLDFCFQLCLYFMLLWKVFCVKVTIQIAVSKSQKKRHHVYSTLRRSFPRRFNVEYTCSVFRVQNTVIKNNFFSQKSSCCKKCPYWEFFWSVFPAFGINTKYSVRMRENTDQKNSEYEHFLRIKMFDWFLSTPLNLLQNVFSRT